MGPLYIKEMGRESLMQRKNSEEESERKRRANVLFPLSYLPFQPNRQT